MDNELFEKMHEQEDNGLYGKRHERELFGLSIVGDMCPSHKRKFENDYIGWHLWAEEQLAKGIEQKRCTKCGRWLFLSEF